MPGTGRFAPLLGCLPACGTVRFTTESSPERPSGVRGFQFLLAKRLLVVQQRAVGQCLDHPLEQLGVLLIGHQLATVPNPPEPSSR